MSIRQDQQIRFGDVLGIVNAAIDDCSRRFYTARGKRDETDALAMAEAKWQLAEIKLRLVDKITEDQE